MAGRLLTVVETSAYLTAAKKFLTSNEREEIVNEVAANPHGGTSLGGGLRKMRIGSSGRGKRGGGRVVYLFGGNHMPIFLLAAFAKAERADLSVVERRALAAVAKGIVAEYDRSK